MRLCHAFELLGVDDEIDARDNYLVIFLLRTLICRCRLAHIIVWGRHQLHVEIYVWRNKAFLVENVHMRAIDELDHGTLRERRGASVQTGIVPTDCGDIHVPGGILGPVLAQKTGLLSLLAKVEKCLQV